MLMNYARGLIMGKFFHSVGQFSLFELGNCQIQHQQHILQGKNVIWSGRPFIATEHENCAVTDPGIRNAETWTIIGNMRIKRLQKFYFLLSPCVRAPIVPFVAWWAPHFSISISQDYPAGLVNPLRVPSARSSSTCGRHAHPLRI